MTANTDYQLTLSASDGLLTSTATVLLTVLNDNGGNTCTTSDPDAVNHTPWNATTAYSAGETVSYNSLVWQAKWWTQGETPSTGGGAWQLSSNVELPWDPSTAYNGGDEVNYLANRYRAKWWTRGNEPGITDVWEEIGLSTCL